ncbi:unnamed protein product [Adineta steineri]|uniref:Nuclear receptor domain-containing protein n=1 Tax=Adineta steineri TaxID=433720 RepID=A0A813RVT0_9BILA|nr:unnamed protein product [Adineta steineri]CAF3537514.1 unnamed protein product [Adineta steineri]
MECTGSKKRKQLLEITDMSNTDGKSSVCHKDLICTVCGAAATGFNFAVITCMCCKAFFRRNALFGLQSLQCRYLSENCAINIKTRRDCSYCRLKKCFEVGMKKDLILTDDLKRIKREKILANRQMTLGIIRPINLFNLKINTQLKEIDSSYLTNIYNAYEEYCRLPLLSFERSEVEALGQQPIKSRIKMQNYIQYYTKHETLLINFFERIPELKQFPPNQQTALCKHNIRFLVRISLMETISNDTPLWPAINLLLQTIYGDLLQESEDLLHTFKEQMNDSTSIRLLLIILLFSTYCTYDEYIDTMSVYKVQEKYTELFWLYLTERHGQLIASQKISIIVRHCLHFQTIGHYAELKRLKMQESNLLLELE